MVSPIARAAERLFVALSGSSSHQVSRIAPTNSAATRSARAGEGVRRVPAWILPGAILAACLFPAGAHATTFTVTTASGASTGSLAYALAHLAPGTAATTNTINFSVTGTIDLNFGPLPGVSAGVTINGPGANLLTLKGNQSDNSIFNIGSADVSISGLTVTNAGFNPVINAGPGDTVTVTNCIFTDNYDPGPGSGGVIYNQGTMTVTGSTFSGNTANINVQGGVIYNQGVMTVTNSTFSGNSVGSGGQGGVIYSTGQLTVTNSTFYGNSIGANGVGGAILIKSLYTVPTTVTNSTFDGNSVSNSGSGGAIFNDGSLLTVTNSIFTANSAGANGFGGGIDTSGGSLTASYDDFYKNIASSSESDCVGCTNLTHSTYSNPNLLPLGNYGGTTETMELGPGSAAICLGLKADLPNGTTTDQRGFALDPTCSSGSVDAGAVQTNQYVVTTLTDKVDANPACASGTGTTCSLRDAIGLANTTPGDITFLPSLSSTSSPGIINLAVGTNTPLPALTGQMNILGPGANQLTVSGGNSASVGSVFRVNPGATVTFYGLTIANGNSPSTSSGGGGINNSGTLTVMASAVSGNESTGTGGDGGGMYNAGTLALIGSTVSGNTAEHANRGGGIYNSGTLTVTNSTVYGNSVNGDGVSAGGGGIDSVGSFTLTGSTVFGNSAVCTGCSYYAFGGGIEIESGVAILTLNNSIVAANSVSGTGGTSYADIASTTAFSGSGNVAYNGPNGTSPYATTILSPLQYNGIGATVQTLIPRPGSPAICAGLVSNIPSGTTTDERGYPNSTIYSGYASNPCVDAGAVQTNYTSVGFVQQPTNTLVNATISPSPTAKVLETDTLLTSNNTDAVNGVPVTLTFNGAGSLSGTLTQTTSGGVASYGSLIPTHDGANDTLETSAITVVTGTVLPAVTSSGFEVIGPAAALSVSAPGSATAGAPFSLTVTAQDSAGNTATGYTGTVSFASSDSGTGRVVPANYTFTSGTSGDNGVHTFTNAATLVTAGARTITATDTTTTSITGMSSTTVSAAAPSVLTASPSTPQLGFVNTPFATPLTVTLTDTYGNPIIGTTITFTPPGSGAGATLTTPAVTSAAGQTSVTATGNGTTGSYSVTASYNGLSAIFRLTNQAIPGYVVNTTADSYAGAFCDTTCSLRDALAASASAGAGNITFSSTAFPTTNTAAQNTITLGSTLNIPSNTTIQGLTSGSGATLTNLVTVKGGNFDVFSVASGVNNAAIANISITSSTSETHNLVENAGTLSITSSSITGPGSSGTNRGIYNDSTGTLNLTASTVSGNYLYGVSPQGAGLYIAGGTVTISNSTVQGNYALGGSGQGHYSAYGGGVYVASGIVNFSNSTITGNESAAVSAYYGAQPSYGAGIDVAGGTVTINNSIVSGDSDAAEITGNYSGTGNLVGNATSLSSLGSYGGPTLTVIPLPGSNAICAGLTSKLLSGETTDQRGYPLQPTGGYCPSANVDIGAVQTNYTSVVFVQQPTNTVVNTSISPSPTVQLLETDTLLNSNNMDAVNGVSVTLSYSGGSGNITGTLAQTTASGVATFSGLKPTSTATGVSLAVGASGAGLQIISGTNLKQTSNTFNVVGPATHFSVIIPSTAIAGTPISVTVTALDANGNTAIGYTGTVAVTTSDSAAVLPGNHTLTSGVGTFSVTLNTVGTQTVTATDTVTSTIAGLSNTTFVAGVTGALTFTESWLGLQPATQSNGPSARSFAAAGNSPGGQMLLFGGANGTNLFNDTWAWSGNQWAQLSPANHPAARWGAGMALDTQHNQTILFGGSSNAAGTTALGDTWFWNGTSWTASGGAAATALIQPAMAYDPIHGQTVLFGGSNGSTTVNQTWLFDGSNWTQASPSSFVPARSGAAMLYDAVHGQIVMFGGVNAGNYMNDTWIWNGTNWTQQSPATNPPGRANAAFVYDQQHGTVILGGGIGASGAISDTWVWNGNNWTNLGITAPSARYGSAAADARESQAGAQIFLFGGTNGTTNLNDGWIFDAPIVTSSLLGVATTGQNYSYTIPVTGGVGPYTFTQDGTPNSFSSYGLNFNSSSGQILGTVTATGGQQIPIGVTITDAQGFTADVTFTLPVYSPIAVPNVVGQSQSAATTAITNAVLTLGTVTTAPSATVPAGYVSSESPAAGTLVNAGSAVNLVISSGPVNYTLTIFSNNTAYGTVTPATGGSYLIGTVVPITATPAAGYFLIGWGGSADIANPASQSTTITMNSDESIYANFAAIPNFVVTTANDDAGSENPAGCTTSPEGTCTLRDALLAAQNADAGNITFSTAAFGSGANITLGDTLSVPSNTTIQGLTSGSGATLTNLVTVAGGGSTSNFPVFTVLSSVSAPSTISGLTITNGYSTSTNAGGIALGYQAGLTLINSTITGNTGGALFNDYGGTLTVINCTISGNSGSFGGIVNEPGGILTVNSSTVSGNNGGGISSIGTSVTVTDSTITGNIGSYSGGGFNIGSGPLTLANTIVAGNTATTNPDIAGTYTDNGGNVIGGVNGVTATNVNLATLAAFGGPTKTMIPLPGSVAICAGTKANETAAGTTTDQRGFANTNTTYPGYSTTTPCVDAGAVQTNYSLTFSTPPSSVVFNAAMSPSPAVTLDESLAPFIVTSTPLPTITIPLTLNGSGTLTGGSVAITDSTGIASYSALSINTIASGDSIAANLTLNANSSPAAAISKTSGSFNVTGIAPAITSGASTTFTTSTAGSFTVTTTGSPTSSLAKTGTLPIGVTFTDNGNGTATLSGTPAAGTGGTYSLSITATNGTSPNATQSFTLTVDQAPAIGSSASTTLTAGTAGSFTVTTTGFPASSVSKTGTLPSGVTFTDNGNGTATLSGTPAAGTGGTYSLSITATNGITPNAAQSFTLTVDQSPAIGSSGSTTLTAGTAGSFTVTTTGFPTSSLSKTGTLPSGLTFTDNGNGTATLSGTPAAGTGGTYSLSITATNGTSPNATQSFTLTVDQSPAIGSSGSTTLTAGTAGSFTVTTTGFPASSVSKTGTLPSGVTFTDNGNGTATLAGTPAAGTGGSYSLSITATNGTAPNATQSFTLTVDQSPAITSTASTTFTTGAAGSFTVTSTGYPAATVSESGALPNGVSFTNNGNGTATLAGTPAAGTGGVYTVQITASNGVGTNAAQSFTLTVNQATAITSASSTTFTAGTAGSFTVTATGYPTPTFTESGALPTGVTLTSAGVLSGAPAAGTGGVYTIQITASNGVGTNAAQSFTLTVGQAPAITSAASTTFTTSAAGSFTVTTTGYPASTLSESGALPTGITFTSNGNGTATLAGAPVAGTGGIYFITINASNNIIPNASQSFTLTVDQSSAITSASSTTFATGTAGIFTITTTGYPTSTLSESGALPTGVSFTSNGNGTATLSGTPAASTGGTYSIIIKANNGIGTYAQQSFTLTVDQSPAITSAAGTAIIVGASGSFTITTSGYPAPTITETGALPAGVALIDNGNGTASLGGTPAPGTIGSYPITITAGNGIGTNATQSFTLTVSPLPTFVVTTSADDAVGNASNCPGAGTSCTLRDALAAAGVVGGYVTFDRTVFASPTTIVLTNYQALSLASNVTVTGPTTGSGPSLTNLVTVSGNNQYPVFATTGASASIKWLNIANGLSSLGGGGINAGSGALSVVNCAFTGNSSNLGGAIYVQSGTLTVSGSTFSNNTVPNYGYGGGAIATYLATTTISNSTFNGNSALSYGGAIYNELGGTLVLENTTISGNSTGIGTGSGGGIFSNRAALTLTNSIVSGNTAPVNTDIFGSYTDNGGNVIGVSGINLAQLGNYGGPTQTVVPIPGSPAICAATLANATAASLTSDQRGFPFDPTCPSGTVDSGAVQTNYSVSFTTEPPASVSAGFNFGAAVTLNENGSIFTAGNEALPLILSGAGTLSGGSMSLVNGVATYTALQVSLPGAGDALTATLTLNPNITPLSISATSSQFNVIASSTTTAAANATTTYSSSAQSVTLSATVSSAGGTVNAGTVTFTVLNGSTPVSSAVTGATVANGSASVSYPLPAATAAGTYIVQAVYNAGGAFTTSSDNTHTLTIGKAAATVALHNLTQTYAGSPLAATATTTPTGLTVTFTYTGTGYPTSATAPNSAGNYSVVATVNDPNYIGTASGTLVINQATPPITWATPTAITYGTSLSVTQLNASSPIAGGFAYTPASGATLTAGSHTLSVIFTPTDTTDYTTATAAVQLTINQATPSITWATPAAITYGTTLSATQLNATSPVAGTFAYSPASGATLTAGTHTLSVTFTPTDATDYTKATSTLQLTVNQATPSIAWSTPAAITYGSALSAIQLNASSTVAGSFTYTPAVGAILTAGAQTLSVTFTPTDTTDYSKATSTVQLTVNQAAPAITWATPTAITYGTALSGTQLDATSPVAGKFAYTPASGATLTAGAHTLSVTFTPTDTTDYSRATSMVQLAVNQATPSIAWSTPAAITYGTPLSATQLNATSPVAGTFVYTPASGASLTAGSHTLSVIFTPTDTTDYTTATAAVQLTINQATPSITWATPAAITYGTTLSATQLNASSLVAGTFAYTPASGATLTAGAHTLSVTFTPTDTTDYSSATSMVQLAVNQATPSIAWSTPAAITYGTLLSATQLDATSPVSGTFAYTPASGVTLTAGPHSLSVTFSPADTTDYTTATSTVQLAVNQSTPSIAWSTPAAITYGTPLTATQLDATSPVAGTFAYTPASGTILTAGPHSLSVTFTPTDTTDYSSATSTVQLAVNQAAQAINFQAPTSPVNYGIAAMTLIATGGASGNPVIFSIVSGPGTLSGSTLTITGTGTLVIAANQAGNANYTAAPQVTQTIVVNNAAQTISFSTGSLAYASGVTFGTTPLTLTATSSSGLAVSFSLVSGPATLSGSTITVSGAGTVVIAANQPGNSDYAAAPQVTESIPVNKALPIAAIASSVNPVLFDNGITLTATITSGAGTPSGAVTFLDGSTALGTGTLSSGAATFTTSSLAVGTHTLTVAYGGDQNFLAATSSPVTELVEDFSFNVSTSSTTITALPGGTAVFNFTATPSEATTFPANIVLSLSGSPQGATYSFSPTVLTAGAGATPVTLTIILPQTQARAADQHPGNQLATNHQNAPRGTVAGRMAPLALALILLPFAGRLRRTGRRMGRILSILMLAVLGIAAVAGISGCGSTSGFFAQQQQSYTVTITGTAGSLSHSTTVTLIVE